MKKYLVLCLLLILITGCNKKINMDVYTYTHQENDEQISINYPILNINKLNKYIKKDVNFIIKNFNSINIEEDNKIKELNIDYTYKVINDNYINITITSSIYDFVTIKNNIYTYVFDKNKNKLLKINDVIDITNEFSNIVTNKFVFDENHLTFFNVINDKIIENKIDINKTNIKVNNQGNIEQYQQYTPVNKIIDPTKPAIALTFDDGPSKYTNKIIELLNKYDCNATFFVLGNKVEHYQETIINALKGGNEIGNHTYNHKWLSRLGEDEIKNQINKTQDIIKEYTNYTPAFLRPTYGSVNKKIKNNTNLQVILWTVDTLDWKINNSKKIANRALNYIKDESIILMHDTYERTYKSLEIMIPTLKEQGYQFVTVSELYEIQKIRNSLSNE